MGFAKQEPREYTRENVLSLNPDQFGVYGICNADRWIYVGQGDIRERMLRHVGGDNPCITRNTPTFWVCELSNDMDTREKELILELQPCCNRRVG